MVQSYIERLPKGGGQLMVDGKPFLMRAAELNNSSLSSRDFMRSVYPRMVNNNVNTVLGSVSWQQIEPEQDRFDFEQLTGVIEDARTHGLRLVLLWFGAFKNGT
jgi:beta-galactosidase GanA